MNSSGTHINLNIKAHIDLSRDKNFHVQINIHLNKHACTPKRNEENTRLVSNIIRHIFLITDTYV